MVRAVGYAVLFALLLGLTPAFAQTAPADLSFSAVPLEPEAAQALRAQGKKIKIPFPNSLNEGNKFNPPGFVMGQLSTDPQQKVLVIFVNFTTPPPGGPTDRLDLSYFDDMLFGTVYDPPEYAAYPEHPTDRTLKNYYHAVSYGTVDVITLDMPSTQGWAQTGHPYDYYCKADGIHDNAFGYYPNNAQGIVIDAVKALDPVVDFSQYAVEGVVPNLFVVYAGTGAEWSGDPGLIWSHSWSLSSAVGQGGYMTEDGVKVNRYAMMPEVGGNLTGYYGPVTGPYPPTVGVYAHEYGHVLGLPDQYDYGYESDGTGIYSLMAGGSWNRYPNERIFNGNSPAFLDAWSRYRLGFVAPTVINDPTSVTIRPAESFPDVYKMIVPYSDGKEYFLFENRQQIGFDQGLARFGPHGLAIYHVDETVFSRNYSRPNEAENWKEFRSLGWQKAWTGETHYAISLIQADDQWHLEHYYYGGFAADLYPGSLNVTSFGNKTFPNSSNYYFWAGSSPKFGYSGVTARNITETDGNINANMLFEPWTSAGK
ncbi:MAG: M6 family metalloprotease domain-containing protein [Terriglobia bacterium]|nr:M6 family metalloprotease domain-containing protein [Terriglobia bacterium]